MRSLTLDPLRMSGHCSKLLICAELFLVSLLPLIAQDANRSPAITEAAGKDLMQMAQRAREYYDKGEYTNAIPLYKQLAQRMEMDLGSGNLLLARTLVVLGAMHNADANPKKALPLLERAVAIIDNRPENDLTLTHDDRIAPLLQIGLACRALEKYEQATSAFRSCLEIQEKAFGPDSTNCCASLKALADLYSD